MYNSSRPEEHAKRQYRSRDGLVWLSLCWTTGIPQLGIPPYEWWNECLHGCASSWIATVFPQAIGMAATWNPELVHRVGIAISDEARAKHHDCLRRKCIEPHTGLTYWSPNVNIFRDPRWGRGQETYGEDPYLASQLAVAFVRALQGEDQKYLKLVATPKHFAVHSGPEKARHSFDARVSERDLWETYLPVFQACVKEAGAASIMAAYNRVNGEPCVASERLLSEILRGAWGFDGFVVADDHATTDLYHGHRVATTPAEAAALALRHGCDLDCGDVYAYLPLAVREGLIDMESIDRAVKRLFAARFRLGMFDPEEKVPYSRIPPSVIACDAHRQLALDVARQSVVLLKNEGNLLPLDDSITNIAVIGPNADDTEVLRGNYAGTPTGEITILEGIVRRARRAHVQHARGCDLNTPSRANFPEAVRVAAQADVAIMVLGNSPAFENEKNHAWESELGDDRSHISLPGIQEDLLKAVCDTGTPVVLVLTTGSALAVCFADTYVPAILNAWYPGEKGGAAIAEVLFGDHNPAGRLPVTFYRSADDLPPFTDYAMEGRTYRYFTGQTLYSFGHGLSYTQFQYSNLRIRPERIRAGDSLQIEVTVENVGAREGDEVAQLYLAHEPRVSCTPIRSLRGFQRVHLEPGEGKELRFLLAPEQLSLVADDGSRVIKPGKRVVFVGGGQPQTTATTEGRNLLTGTCEVDGRAILPR